MTDRNQGQLLIGRALFTDAADRCVEQELSRMFSLETCQSPTRGLAVGEGKRLSGLPLLVPFDWSTKFPLSMEEVLS